MTRSPYRPFIRSSFLSLVAILLGSVVVVYAISPRRDPSFVPTSSNAGSLAAWAAVIPEAVWIRGSMILAVALAINSVLLLWNIAAPRLLPTDRGARLLVRLTTSVAAVLLCLGFAYVLWFGLVWYLLVQAIVD